MVNVYLTRVDALFRISRFFLARHKTFIVAAICHGEKGSGNWKMYGPSSVAFEDIARAWLSSCPSEGADCRSLILLLDICYSGEWVKLAHRLRYPRIFVQSSVAPHRQARDRFDQTFTNYFLKFQKASDNPAALEGSMLGWYRPHAYVARDFDGAHIGEVPLVPLTGRADGCYLQGSQAVDLAAPVATLEYTRSIIGHGLERTGHHLSLKWSFAQQTEPQNWNVAVRSEPSVQASAACVAIIQPRTIVLALLRSAQIVTEERKGSVKSYRWVKARMLQQVGEWMQPEPRIATEGWVP